MTTYLALGLLVLAFALYTLAHRLATENADLLRLLVLGNARAAAPPERIPITSEEPYPYREP